MSVLYLDARGGIRTPELLRDWTLNPAPLTGLGNPRLVHSVCQHFLKMFAMGMKKGDNRLFPLSLPARHASRSAAHSAGTIVVIVFSNGCKIISSFRGDLKIQGRFPKLSVNGR